MDRWMNGLFWILSIIFFLVLPITCISAVHTDFLFKLTNVHSLAEWWFRMMTLGIIKVLTAALLLTLS